MKHAWIALSISLFASSAYAGNAAIEDALKSRDDLSMFYQAMVNTGVMNELSGGSYTVFAPTNDAFAKLTAERYPCFYSPECKEEVAEIIRNHIVEGEQHLGDVARGNGGLHSINKRFISIAQPTRDNFSVDGHEVLRSSGLFGSVLYKIDGVIANPIELSRTERPPYTMEKQATTDTATPSTDCPENDCGDTRPEPVSAAPVIQPAR
jgi:uncharacterized surface protein with fasciclin (FAS1) repeats